MAKKLEISNNIRKLRFFANEMTQQELAEKAGVSRQTIIAIEAGKYTPSLELAFRIADVFAACDTPQWPDCAAFALPLVGLARWEDWPPGSPDSAQEPNREG